MKRFELHQSSSLDDARGACTDGALLKAAGIDVLDRLKERNEAPGRVVNLMPLAAELGTIQATGSGALRVGALATIAALADAVANDAHGALREAADTTATPQVRHRATVGGNLLQKSRCWYLRNAEFDCIHGGVPEAGCQALVGDNRYHAVLGYSDCVRVHPSNLAPALLVLDAQCTVHGADGARTMPIAGLWQGLGTALQPEHTLADDEILTAIDVPAPRAGQRSSYRESREKQSFDWATTAAAVTVVVEGGRITEGSICLSAVSPMPFVADKAAALLRGQAPSEALFQRVARAAFAQAAPLTHNAYKVEVGQATLRDALRAACGQ